MPDAQFIPPQQVHQPPPRSPNDHSPNLQALPPILPEEIISTMAELTQNISRVVLAIQAAREGQKALHHLVMSGIQAERPLVPFCAAPAEPKTLYPLGASNREPIEGPGDLLPGAVEQTESQGVSHSGLPIPRQSEFVSEAMQIDKLIRYTADNCSFAPPPLFEHLDNLHIEQTPKQ